MISLTLSKLNFTYLLSKSKPFIFWYFVSLPRGKSLKHSGAEQKPPDPEVVGSNLARFWVFSLLLLFLTKIQSNLLLHLWNLYHVWMESKKEFFKLSSSNLSNAYKGILPLTTLITEQQYKAIPSKTSTPQYLGPGGWAASHLNPFQSDRKKNL